MCGPLMAAAPLLTALSAGATAVSVVSNLVGAGKQQQAIKQQISNENQSAAIRDEQRRDKLVRLQGQQMAKYAASGVTMRGSPQSLFDVTAEQVDLDAFSDQLNTNTRINNLRSSSDSAMFGAVAGAGNSLLNFGVNNLRRG